MTAAPSISAPAILPCGDGAVSVDFGNVIDLGVNARVRALDAALQEAPPPGLIETVPTYRSLLVVFDPLASDYDGLLAHLEALAARDAVTAAVPRRWRVPAIYGGAFGEDLDEMAAFAGLTAAALVEAHAAPVYRIMMIGFMPGFSYLGGLDERLWRPRRDVPRAKIPAASISIGGAQTAIGSTAGPSGWHLIGRTPALPFMKGRDPVFLFEAGDEVVFAPISEAEWRSLSAAAAEGAPVVERLA